MKRAKSEYLSTFLSLFFSSSSPLSLDIIVKNHRNMQENRFMPHVAASILTLLDASPRLFVPLLLLLSPLPLDQDG